MILILEILLYSLAAIGGLALLAFIAWFVGQFWKYFLRCPYNLFERYGASWVVVSGGTDGIGLGFAKYFAEQGFKVAVIGRNQDKLKWVVEHLAKLAGITKEEEIKARFTSFHFDFSKAVVDTDYKKIVDELNALDDISVLVNDTGMVFPGGYEKESTASI